MPGEVTVRTAQPVIETGRLLDVRWQDDGGR
jgi:hypothetical protein